MDFECIIERQPYGDFITVDVAEPLIAAVLEAATPKDSPVIVHMLGVPGAGKSTYVAGLDTKGKVVIGFDAVMESLPDYQACKAAQGLAAAFSQNELAARMLGYEMLHRAVTQKLDVIFDHGGARADHVAFLHAIKAQFGYRVEVVHVNTPVNTAASRVEQRETQGGRHTPSHYIDARAGALAALMPDYRLVADKFVSV